MIVYKITDKDGKTRAGTSQETQWGDGVTHELPKRDNPLLCTEDVLHCYTNANLGLLLNPIHGRYMPPRLWEATTDEIAVSDYGKAGVFALTIARELVLPAWYTDGQVLHRVRVRFAVLCARAVLRREDKASRKAIEAAEKWLEEPTEKNARAADAAYTAYAAYAAAYAADAAYAACAAYAAYAAARAADAAARAADAAACAADAAACAADAAACADIDFAALADQAVAEEMTDET